MEETGAYYCSFLEQKEQEKSRPKIISLPYSRDSLFRCLDAASLKSKNKSHPKKSAHPIVETPYLTFLLQWAKKARIKVTQKISPPYRRDSLFNFFNAVS